MNKEAKQDARQWVQDTFELPHFKNIDHKFIRMLRMYREMYRVFCIADKKPKEEPFYDMRL